MGYCAQGIGGFHVCANAEAAYRLVRDQLEVYDPNDGDLAETPADIRKQIIEEGKEIAGLSIEFCNVPGKPGLLWMDVEHGYNYYSDETFAFLSKLKPILHPLQPYIEGIEFEGDDGEHWLITVNDEGEIVDTHGEVLFDGPPCDRSECVYCHQGRCHSHKVHGRYPAWSDGVCSEQENGTRRLSQDEQAPYWTIQSMFYPYPIQELEVILDALKKYGEEHCWEGVLIRSISHDAADDGNNRIDIEVSYTDANRKSIYQKLWMMRGEIIDGVEFHKRFEKFYPEK